MIVFKFVLFISINCLIKIKLIFIIKQEKLIFKKIKNFFFTAQQTVLAQAPSLLQSSSTSPQLLNHHLAYSVTPPTQSASQNGTTQSVANNQSQPLQTAPSSQLNTPSQQVQVTQQISNGQYILPFLQNINEDVSFFCLNFF